MAVIGPCLFISLLAEPEQTLVINMPNIREHILLFALIVFLYFCYHKQ